MEYFLFICIFFFLVIYQNNLKNYTHKATIFYIFVFIIVFALGLRGNEDEYTRVYLIFPNLSDFFLDENSIYLHQKGILFAFIIAVLKSLQLNSQSLIFLFCFISIFLNAFFFRKYTEYYCLAFLIYLSHGLINKELAAMRMGLSSALLLPMIYYLHNGKRIKFIILAVAASLVQYVAVLSFFLIFLNRKINPKILLICLFISTMIYQFNIISFFINFFIQNDLLPFYIKGYLLHKNPYVYDAGLLHYKTIQQIIVVILLIVFFSNNKFETPKYYHLLFNAYYLGTIFIIIFAKYSLFAFRFSGHFTSVEPILITYFIILFKQKYLVSNILSLVTLLIAYLNYVILSKVTSYLFLVKNMIN